VVILGPLHLCININISLPISTKKLATVSSCTECTYPLKENYCPNNFEPYNL
jgi:hypothetical protein